MIDNNKLLSRNQVSRGRNIVTIKRNLIKINNLLKERLVLTKIRQGIMMQEEENRIRRQREDNLESLEPTRKIEDDKPKDNKKNSGLLAALATLGLLFLPGLKKLLDFLNDIKDRVGNMAKLLLKAMTDFKDKSFAFLNKVNLANFDKDKIQTTFAKFEKDLKNYVTTLLVAGVANLALSASGNLRGVNIQNLIKRGRKTKVDDVLDDVPVGEDSIPFEFGTFRKTPVKIETPVTLRADKNFNIKLLRSTLKKTSGKNYQERVDILEKAAQVLRAMRQGVSSKAGGELTRGNKANFDQINKILKDYDKELQKIDRAIKFIKRNDKLTINEAIEQATKNIRLRSIRGRIKKLEDIKSKILGDEIKGGRTGRYIKKKRGNKVLNKIKREKKYLGGRVTLGTYKLGEQGPEFIIDADSTLAIENTAPGFLNALNKAEGFQSIDVLRNYASYEGGHLQTASFLPVFIPSPSNKKSQIMLAVSGGNGSRQTVFSKIHDKR